LSRYYEWATQAILRVTGMSRTLLDGSQSGPYASASINRDVYSSFIGSLRNAIVKAYQKRIDTAVRKLDLRMLRTDDEGERRVMFVDEFGNLTFDPTDTPAYEEASLSFDNDILKDPNQELNTLNTLIHMDVPVSKQTIVTASGLDLDLASQMRQIAEEDKLKDKLSISDEQLPMSNNPSQTKDIDETKDDYTSKKPIGGSRL
jgi:S-adenosylmethionine hydrolase